MVVLDQVRFLFLIVLLIILSVLGVDFVLVVASQFSFVYVHLTSGCFAAVNTSKFVPVC